jgi:hypothetical protein
VGVGMKGVGWVGLECMIWKSQRANKK